MERIKKITVHLNFSGRPIQVGEIAENDGKIYFKYFSDFVHSGIALSPYKLPLSNAINEGPDTPFGGLFGLFDDSLPDGWGRLLLDRKLMSRGILPQEMTPLDRLAFVGDNGAGALTYEPVYTNSANEKSGIDLDHIAANALEIYEGTSAEIIEKLFELGGSSGGARPKILAGYHPEKDQLISSSGILPNGFEHWIIKFRSTTDFDDMAEVEYAYYLMALDAGIVMSNSKLFTGKSGKKYFATKRFDRRGNNRLHLHSASGLLHDNFRRSTLDYGHLMDAAFELEKNIKAYEKVLRIAAFNLFAHNRDDHSKNFSFLMHENGSWEFAPAYDLTFSHSSYGFHSTTIAGEGDNPTEKHLAELAKEFDVKGFDELLSEVKIVCQNWTSYAKRAGVSPQTTRLIAQRLAEVYERAGV